MPHNLIAYNIFSGHGERLWPLQYTSEPWAMTRGAQVTHSISTAAAAAAAAVTALTVTAL